MDWDELQSRLADINQSVSENAWRLPTKEELQEAFKDENVRLKKGGEYWSSSKIEKGDWNDGRLVVGENDSYTCAPNGVRLVRFVRE